MRQILLATTNLAKREKLRWLLAGLDLEPVDPEERSVQVPLEETAGSHRANAVLKAVAASHASSTLAIASDGGLLVPALGPAWDSLRTHRFAGEAADDHTRLEELLRLMKDRGGQARRAHWVEALAVAEAGSLLAAWQEQGGSGLLLEGFDPSAIYSGFWAATIWYFPEVGKTYAQMSEQEQASIGDPWSKLKLWVQNFFRGRSEGQGLSRKGNG